MKKTILFLILFTTSFSSLTTFAQSPFVGTWEGAIAVQGIKLGLTFDISETAPDKFTSTMDVPMQGAKDIPATSMIVKEKEVAIFFEALQGQYLGSLSEDENSINGTWSQNGQSFELLLSKTKQKESLLRPQEPKAPFPYEITETHFHNHEAGDIELFGTLTMPEGDGPFPAVVLISGSGPQNRDEELMGHKPFWIIADHFSRNGIAVLRYDDRGVAYSQGDFSKATSADFATDAAAAVKFLKYNPKINPDKIGFCGHSEGGMVAPLAAAGSDEYAFLVLMAGPGQNIVDLLLLQSELISKAMGETSEDIKEGNRVNKKIYAIVTGEGSTAERKTALRAMLEKEYQSLSKEDQKEQGPFEDSYAGIEAQMFNPWMEYFLKYEPSTYLKQVSCPVLAINGEKDLQVAPKENLTAIAAALEAGPCKDYTTKELKGLNHLFQESETGAPSEYGELKQTFAPEALELMTKWILER